MATSFSDFGTTVLIMLVGLLLFLLLYMALHLSDSCKRLVAARSYIADPLVANFKKPMTYPFSWLLPVMRATEADIIQISGLDAAVYLRMFLYSIQLFLILSIICMPVLIPVNIYSSNLPASSPLNSSSSLDNLTASNVPTGSDMLWAHFTMLYAVSIATFLLTWVTYRHVWHLRQEYLAERAKVLHAEEYSVLVTDIPKSRVLRRDDSSVGLIGPAKGFRMKVRRSSLVQLYAVIRTVTMGLVQPPQQADRGSSTAAMESRHVDNFFRRIYGAAFVANQGIASFNYVHRTYSQWVHAVRMLDRTRFKQKLKTERIEQRRAAGRDGVVGGGEEEEEDGSSKAYHRVGWMGLWGERVESIPYWIGKVEEAAAELKKEQAAAASRRRTGAAFVVFNSRKAASAATQTLHALHGTKWLVHAAPQPEDVIWPNLEPKLWERSIRQQVGVALFVLLVLFFYIPVGAISAITSIAFMQKIFPSLKKLSEDSFVYKMLSTLLPALGLRIMYWVAPPVLMLLGRMQGCISVSSMERLAAQRFYYLLLFNVFLGYAITNSLVSQIISIYENPKEALSTLGTAIPRTSSFFISYVIISTLLFGVELLRLPIQFFVFLYRITAVGKAIGDREKLWSQNGLVYHIFMPYQNLIITLGLVFSVIAPLILPFVLFYSLVGMFIWKHQIMYIYSVPYQTGGLMWIPFVNHVMTALIIAQLTLIGFFILKAAYVQAGWCVPLPLITFYLITLLNSQFASAFKTLPMDLSVEVDDHNAKMGLLDDINLIPKEYVPRCMQPITNPDLDPAAGPADNIYELVTPQPRLTKVEVKRIQSLGNLGGAEKKGKIVSATSGVSSVGSETALLQSRRASSLESKKSRLSEGSERNGMDADSEPDIHGESQRSSNHDENKDDENDDDTREAQIFRTRLSARIELPLAGDIVPESIQTKQELDDGDLEEL